MPRRPVVSVSKLRISVTDRCNLRCLYCMPPEGIPLEDRSEILRYEEIAEIAGLMARFAGLKQARLTGGEPLLRAGLPDLVRMLAKAGVGEIALTTNGQLLAGLAAALKDAGLGRVNVSLDSLDRDKYSELTLGGTLDRTLAGLDAAVAAGLTPVKINTVVLRGYNFGELPALARFAASRGFTIRFLEAMRIGELAAVHEERFVPAAEMIAALEAEFEVRILPHPWGGTSRPAVLKDRKTGRESEAGFIASESLPFCSSCSRLRLTATGMLLPCLLGGEGEDLKARIREGGLSGQDMRDIVRKVLMRKPRVRGKENRQYMSRIGG